MRLPPYGQQYLDELPSTGVQIAYGPTAWKFAEMQPFTVMVLPPGEDPHQFEWPSNPHGAVLHERGLFDDASLYTMALVLLVAGNPFVVARREALLQSDPMVWFYPEAVNVS